MRRLLEKHLLHIVVLLALIVTAAVVAIVLLARQGVGVPAWVPIFGQNVFNLEAELSSAQAVTPGQGQSVNIAGVDVGEISRVRLENGRAVVTMQLRKEFKQRIFKDASILLRPKTGLKDMVAELTPGTAAAGRLGKHDRIPISQTLPDVNFDEVLASLDGDTRKYVQLLLANGSEGLRGNGRVLASVLRRLSPTARDLSLVAGAVAERRENLKRVVHNLSLLFDELGNRDTQLAAFVRDSNDFFATLAKQDSKLRETFAELPATLEASRSALDKGGQLARELGPTLESLRPSARDLAGALKSTRPFLRETVPVIHDQLRPFTRAARPLVQDLRPASEDLAALTPNLTSSFKVLNTLLNALAHKPKGQEGYLFWLAWNNHLGASMFASQDAHGPMRRGMFVADCDALRLLESIALGNRQLGTLIGLLNAPKSVVACAATSASGAK